MINLILKGYALGFENDIRELVQAFYPMESFRAYAESAQAIQNGKAVGEADEAILRLLRQEAGETLASDGTELSCDTEGRKKAEAVFDLSAGTAVRAQGIALFAYEDSAPVRFTLVLDGAALLLCGVRKKDKGQIKTALYRFFEAYTGKSLPWGTLTGIRPVKLAEEFCAQYDETLAAHLLERDYLISPEKRDLIMDIALREQRLLESIQKKTGHSYREGWSLYIGIPFCPTRCLYCSFTSNPIEPWTSELDAYLSGLERELLQAREAMQGQHLQTIYIGGGTPTALPEPWLAKLMALVQRIFPLSEVAEFTVEAGRPDSITEEKLRILKEAGVGRISINPQTFNQKTLDLIGRRHTTEAVKETFALARAVGFDNINMDIILGLPNEHLSEVAYTLSEVGRLHPESLTVHSLAIKRAARLTLEKDVWANVYRAGNDMETMQQMMAASAYTAALLELPPYYLYRQKNMAGNLENVGYAREDNACLYNILMMEEKHSVVGCGAGCATKLVLAGQNRVERYENVKSIRDYLSRTDELLEKKARFFASVK